MFTLVRFDLVRFTIGSVWFVLVNLSLDWFE